MPVSHVVSPRRSLLARFSTAVVFAFGCSLALPAPAEATEPALEVPPARLDVNVHGLRNARGVVRCIAYDSAQGFPEATRHVIARVAARPEGANARCSFDALPAGREIAVVIHHDENDDNVFQRGLFGLPLEGYGFSNDARPVLAAPSFEACRFRLSNPATSLRITARY